MGRNASASPDLEHYVVSLGESTLRSIAERAIGGTVATVKAGALTRDWPEYGVCGDKCAVSMSCTMADGSTTDVEAFVKRQTGHSGYKETPHYEYLNSCGLPVPRLYGGLLDENQMEVLFLEDVEPNIRGDRLLRTTANLREFIGLAARINALVPDGEYGRDLYYFSRDRGLDRGLATLQEICTSAEVGHLGKDLGRLCSPTLKQRLLSLAMSLKNRVAEMERGYGHNEYLPQQVGRRRSTGEMVVFDLRTTGLGPRFLDVAPWIGCPNGIEGTGVTPTDLADHYIQEYQAAGRATITLDTLMDETRTLWQAKTISQLDKWYGPALKGRTCPGKDILARDQLFGDLSDLLETASDR